MDHTKPPVTGRVTKVGQVRYSEVDKCWGISGRDDVRNVADNLVDSKEKGRAEGEEGEGERGRVEERGEGETEGGGGK